MPEAFDPATLLATLPDAPGVYRMLGAADEVLYVGKAKNLKKRVSSYFQKTAKSPRIGLMLTQVRRVDITATRSEAEALILENTLIKRLAPKYNILFRDDKSYPYIVLTGDACPRLAFHRGSFARDARYFGPYPNSLAVREAIQLLQKIFQLRTCENAVFAHRSRPCLLYQIKRCTAPCVGLISAEDYAADVRNAEMFLRGQHGEVIDRLTAAMQQAADALRFEEATQLRDQVRALQAVLHRQYVSTTDEENVDILAGLSSGGMFCVNLAMVRGGQHLGDCAHFPRGTACSVEGEEAEALLAFVEQHYLAHPAPARLILGHDIGHACAAVFEAAGVKVVAGPPRNERERAWLTMAENNARLALEARHHAAGSARARLEALAEVLDCGELPGRIECFDISHTQGEGTVASCVVCIDGSMKKSEYRRFNIGGIQPGDDYAAMRQALLRRYEKVAAGEAVAPDLIIIDGGKGQLGVAREALAELGLQHLASIGVAKGESRKPGLETLLLGDALESLQLAASHPALHLIQEVRDEAHRFAIFGHRARRDKARRRSRLEDVPGVGAERRRRLLASFGGLQGVMAATVEDLCRVEGIGRALAQKIHDELH
ncbi:excinuclease UvrABC, endonuclease subunit [Sterolibacterium denitrificans]|uniref:UvrABC system protein C n=1 Tax=Sterolibacterium denitrificans TaxID=157592 RepID=A0A7Z7HRG8_9PROT|nr:excinuclease ABC subunit UvrC [Sterolibacterium denitrificans]SMB26738.1 excinuclease UvrABC, endonuclease subunit [Sterolibacterium denitrificans]